MWCDNIGFFTIFWDKFGKMCLYRNESVERRLSATAAFLSNLTRKEYYK